MPTFEADARNEGVSAQAFVEVSLDQRLAAHLIFLQWRTGTTDVGHILAAATEQRLVTVIAILRYFVDHCRAVQQGRALGANGTLRAGIVIGTRPQSSTLRFFLQRVVRKPVRHY